METAYLSNLIKLTCEELESVLLRVDSNEFSYLYTGIPYIESSPTYPITLDLRKRFSTRNSKATKKIKDEMKKSALNMYNTITKPALSKYNDKVT